MATIYEVHPQTPQIRRIDEIVAALKNGAVMLYPTDTVYAIGCDLNSKTAVSRVRQIKQMSNDKPLTFLCQSLSNISEYAIVSGSGISIDETSDPRYLYIYITSNQTRPQTRPRSQTQDYWHQSPETYTVPSFARKLRQSANFSIRTLAR